VFEPAIGIERSRLINRHDIDIDSQRFKPALSRGLDRKANVATDIDEARSNHVPFDTTNAPSSTTHLRVKLLTVLTGFIILTVKLTQLGRGRHGVNVR
jgi:hypothetical protein